jgi:hypothetical protein
MNSIPTLNEWARATFDNPRALLAKKPPARKQPAADEREDVLPELPEAEKRILASMSKPRPPAKAAAGYQILSPADLLSSPTVRDIVLGVLPPVGIGGIVGASMSGKGFLIFDLMAILAEGGCWFGCRVDKVRVIYICLEGAGGLHKRIRAWEKKNGRKYPDIGIITSSFDLRNPAQVAALIATIRDAGFAGGVIVIDTLAQAAPGTDENSSRDMGEIIAALQSIQAALGGLVLTVHHLGKDATRGPRGHSSFLASLDACIEVRRDGDRRSWVVAKVKDDADGAEHFFRLEIVELGEDEDGESITSCIVAPDESPTDAMRRTLPPKSGNQRIIWDAIGELLRESKTFGKAGAPGGRPCIEIEPAIDRLRTRLACDPKRQTERTRDAITGLVGRGLLILRDDWIWCA